MTPEAQRIAIAEWCGWKPCGRHCQITSGRDGIMRISPDGKNAVTASLLPDYLNDLNSIHEAEGKLTIRQKNQYANALRFVCADIDVWHATAAQRAEALLRTLNLWKD